MTPSNPSNQNPFILCIMDALGIPHQVAPLNHTHTYAEVPGLNDELSELWSGLGEKANQEDMTEALAGKQNVLSFDSTPTAGSTNPVTSGGVKAALDGKAPLSIATVSYFAKSDETEKLNLDTIFSDGKEIANYIIENVLGEECRIEDFFTSTQGEPFYGSEVLKQDSYAIVKIICFNDGSTTRYFIVVEGMYDK